MSDPDDDDFDSDLEDGFARDNSTKRYPKCYVDTKHDGDPICKPCALELYDAIPKKKFKYPRNCWNCEEMGLGGDSALDVDESFFD